MNFEDADKISITEATTFFCGRCRHEKVCEELCDFMSDLEGFLQRYQEG